MWSNQIVLKSYTEHTKIRIYEINSRRVTESVGTAEKIFYEPHKSGHSASQNLTTKIYLRKKKKCFKRMKIINMDIINFIKIHFY